MNNSFAENPKLYLAIGLGLLVVVTFAFTINFVRKSKVSVKAEKGSVGFNGKNSGNISTNNTDKRSR
ncbi:hypothetical protein RX830_01525 [Pseudomonas syringae pv. actinidiae]|uniref:hypothetical protein n=1 Tax=Pseudomonas coronafaciens TaxID=53409 RepID=UPI0011C34EA2|nr:hypothetical protein [Pseudomonas coronafaciens]MDU8264703.1 hypothetical protein [Pseudomonas syringae pv. actinidiae]MDU8280560.1 hypothetical protein [Pseudomonas syringae pv. actinidiae]MDU8301953.1 hypothetical protein [Pseudomonas syringae pv. actinidiae]